MLKVKFFSILFLGIFLMFQLKTLSPAIAASATSSQTTQDSYVLFYPVVAGKTEGESFYFLKLIRDRIGELLTFGNEKKSEYCLKIATKRLLEAEKLFKTGKANLTKNTLSKFTIKLATAYDYAIFAQKSEFYPELLDQISQETQKYQIVLSQLLTISPEEQKKFVEEASQRVAEIQNKVNQRLKE